MAGMQGKPLPKKLGIKAGHRVCLLGAPRTIVRRLTCDEVRIAEDLRHPLIDVAVLFVDRVADLERRFADIAGRLHPSGGFWVAWPKKKRGADITEEVVRRIALAAGMIDNKICTMGDSMAIRLVLRGQNRDAMAYRAEPPPVSRRVRRTPAAARVVRSSGAGSSLHRARARSTK
ncbi:MAG TPA: hypothetical protein VGG28_00290 [Kofleriaceae bacterium]